MRTSAIQDNNNNSSGNMSYVCVRSNWTAADDRAQLLAWLSPLEPRLRHRDIRERRVDNVGEWLMQTDEFGSWQDWSGDGGGDNTVLFCYGDPGVGKTFISSLVVDSLCDGAGGHGAAVACFYFDLTARKEQSAASVLGSLLKQMVSGMEWIPEEILQIYQEQKKAIGGRCPGLPDIVKMLQKIATTQRTFMCIDAMDECAAVERVKLLDSLKQILEKSPAIRIFMTGRPHIRTGIETRLAGRVVSVSVISHQDDIVRYLRVRLDQDENPDAMDESLKADILRKIPKDISGMFLLVSLNIEAILEGSTICRRREKLSKMPPWLVLEDAYGATMERIRGQDMDKARLGIAALMWISHAERPLQVDELCHALAVELGSADFDAANIPSMPTLMSCCQGLITVDKEESTVRLIHFTLLEYLSAHPNVFNKPHSTIAEICLTYLNSPHVKVHSSDPYRAARDTPFLQYCSVYWGAHAKRKLSDRARSLVLQLFHEDYSHISTKFLLGQVGYSSLADFDTCSGFSGLHCASFFGIAEVIPALRDRRCDLNRGNFLGYTPLAWAAHNGHEEAVRLLLGWHDCDLNKSSDDGRTPLSFAAGHGHEGVVKQLLERRELDPEELVGCRGGTISYDIFDTREQVWKTVPTGGLRPDKPDNFNLTPLTFAAWNGHEGVVKMLLGLKAVNPDNQTYGGRTPLSYAAEGGHEGVVKILLATEEVNPDEPDNEGRTPLSFAAENGREGVVRVLLGRAEVNHDKPDNGGRTPLSYATSPSVITLLLF